MLIYRTHSGVGLVGLALFVFMKFVLKDQGREFEATRFMLPQPHIIKIQHKYSEHSFYRLYMGHSHNYGHIGKLH